MQKLWRDRTPAPDAPAGRPRLRARRGAAMVLATIVFTGMVVMMSVTVDVSRVYSMKNELQTSADAAAMAAAVTLLDEPSEAEARAAAVGAQNTSGQARPTLSSIVWGSWDDAARTFTPTPIEEADAVQVVMRSSGRYLFTKLIGLDTMSLGATATAWATAPVAGVTRCAKPWGVAYEDIMQSLGKAPNAVVTTKDLRRMKDTTRNKLGIRLHYDDDVGGGNYGSIVLPPVNDPNRGGRGGREYRENITGCNELHVGDIVETEPGKKKGPTLQGLAEMCKPLRDGKCYNEKGGIGVPITVAVWKDAHACGQGGGRKDVTVDFIATIILTDVDEHSAEIGGFLYALNEQGPVIPGTEPIEMAAVHPMLVR